jgi:hypothetical protein
MALNGAKALRAKKFSPKCFQSVQRAKRFEISPPLLEEGGLFSSSRTNFSTTN